MLMKYLSRIDSFDQKLILAIKDKRSPIIITLLKIFTESARGYCWASYVIALNFLNLFGIQFLHRQDQLLKMLTGPLLAWFLGKWIKVLVKRPRPFQKIKDFKALTHSPIDDSFPSLHAASSTSFFMGLLLIHHPYALWVGLWAAVVTFSRLYLGVHYLSDLLGGMVIGLLSGLIVVLFMSAAGFL